MNRSKTKTPLHLSIETVRVSLIDLHKVLVDQARADYEKKHKPVQSPGEWLGLLMSDPFFEWLRPLTALITSIDELLDGKQMVGISEATALRAKIEDLITEENAANEGFKTRYLDMFQRNPTVVMAHSDIKSKIAKLEIQI